MAYDEQLAERVREAIGARDGVTERKMFGGIGWMVAGNMAVGVMSDGGLLVRLPPDEAEAAWREPGAGPFGREGAKPMTGFVRVEVLGALQPTPTFVTNYAIYPFVGEIESGFEYVLEAREVDHILELRLRDLRDGYGRRRLVRRGVPFRTDTYCVGDHMIWGATARIVADLLDRVEGFL